MRIAFVDGRLYTKTASNEADRPMSGILSAAIGLRSALARRGHDVHYFASSPVLEISGGVACHTRSSFAKFAQNTSVDVLIVIPDLLPILLPLRAKVRVLWTGNAFRDGEFLLRAPFVWAPDLGRPGLEARLYTMSLFSHLIDQIVVGSEWQAQHMRVSSGLPSTKFTVLYLGVDLQHYRGLAPSRHPHRVVYASQARRGLDILLSVFPEVRRAVPDAELHIFGYEYASDADLPRDTSQGQAGVHWKGALSKSDLAREFRSAAIMAYPCTFRETFCLAIAEAQAAGLPVVTTDLAALTERVTSGTDGILIGGKAQQRAYQDAFVHAVIRLLRNATVRDRLGRRAADKAQRLYDWEQIASGWETELERAVMGREPALPTVDPDLNLLRPDLLRVSATDRTAKVTAESAETWLRTAWSAYGLDPATAPGLPRADD